MSTLQETILTPDKRPAVVASAVELVESEVKSKGGISGVAIKTGFKAVNAVKPTLVRDAVDNLLDRFVAQLEPFFADWEAKGRPGTFEGHLTGQKKAVANALLGVTDARAKTIEAGAVKKTYEKLRPMGEKNVEAAVPGLGRTIQKYL